MVVLDNILAAALVVVGCPPPPGTKVTISDENSPPYASSIALRVSDIFLFGGEALPRPPPPGTKVTISDGNSAPYVSSIALRVADILLLGVVVALLSL